jgi:hypothetical protein
LARNICSSFIVDGFSLFLFSLDILSQFLLFFSPSPSEKALSSYAKMSGIGNKRAAGEPGTSVPPEKKTAVEDSGTTVETIKLGGVSSTV